MRPRSPETEVRRLRRLLRESARVMERAMKSGLPADVFAALGTQRREIDIALAPKRPSRPEDPVSRRTTKQRRAARRRRFRVHVLRCKRFVAEVGPMNIIAACLAVWRDHEEERRP